MLLNKTVKNISRLGEVINVLLKYSFEDIISSTALRRFVPPKTQLNWKRQDRSVFDHTRWERIRFVIEELGPTFIKLAQVLSNRPDILPEPLIKEFSKLQNHVPPFSTKVARSIIEKETGKSIDELFSYFDAMTIGSASLGQVHRARLRTGQDVVVKVQRPGVYRKVTTDLALLHEFVRLTENYFINQGILNPLEVVDSFETTMLQELDYNTEAKSIEQFKHLYKHYRKLYVPKAYRDLTTDKILVLEFISGCKINDSQQLTDWGLNPKKIVEQGLEIYLKQIFEYGIFHADPHPGNVLVKPDGTIALIDFGMVGKLTKKQKFAFAGILISLAQEDPKAMASNLRKLAVNSEIGNMQQFENDLDELIEDFIVLDVSDMNISDLTGRLQVIIYDYQLKVPGVIFLIFRALAILEGVAVHLNPNFDILESIRPYGVKIMAEQYSGKNIRSEVNYTLSHLSSLLYTSPIDIKYILKKLRSGELRTNVELHGYQDFLDKIDSLTNRLNLTLLITALLITSGVSMQAQINMEIQKLFGIPIISFIGFALSGLLSLFLMLAAIRNRRRRH